jgi:hypothetical protein
MDETSRAASERPRVAVVGVRFAQHHLVVARFLFSAFSSSSSVSLATAVAAGCSGAGCGCGGSYYSSQKKFRRGRRPH